MKNEITSSLVTLAHSILAILIGALLSLVVSLPIVMLIDWLQ